MKIFLISFSLVFFGLACQNKGKTVVDRIIYNAHIITMDDSIKEAEVMVVKDGKILAIGNKSLLEKYLQRRQYTRPKRTICLSRFNRCPLPFLRLCQDTFNL